MNDQPDFKAAIIKTVDSAAVVLQVDISLSNHAGVVPEDVIKCLRESALATKPDQDHLWLGIWNGWAALSGGLESVLNAQLVRCPGSFSSSYRDFLMWEAPLNALLAIKLLLPMPIDFNLIFSRTSDFGFVTDIDQSSSYLFCSQSLAEDFEKRIKKTEHETQRILRADLGAFATLR